MDREVKPFKLVSKFSPTGDQPAAIESILKGIEAGKKVQVIRGATGTGKTFTDANIIAALNRPTLVMVHNKTLASQLYAEFKELFPENRVEYFISNFDFYQPEAYLPKSDTYIDKNAVTNLELDMMRTSAMNSVLSRRDTIVVASVAAIYGLTDPAEYEGLIFEIRVGETLDRKDLYRHLIDAQYTRDNFDLKPGTFRVHGDIIDIAPATHDYYIRVDCFGDEVENIFQINTLSGEIERTYATYPIFPAYDHASTRRRIEAACKTIKEELEMRLKEFRDEGKLLEAERLEMRTNQDIESLLEFGRCPGIENYSRHIDGRKPGERPFTLIDYMPKDYLLLLDESHVTIPQIRGMYNGDRSRKETLVEYGFRLPSALDNRPLNFAEFEALMPSSVVCTSATPGDYELGRSGGEVVEQIIRPTGLLDPTISVRPTSGQIDDLLFEINKRIEASERVMVVTLTIKMAEDLTAFLKEKGIKVTYLHNETKTLERSQIIYQLRKGKYDVLVGINLLREGLDIPEVSLIAILDADKEGFLRSTRSLIQIIGRAARNANGQVIMYADSISDSMREAIDETMRRRGIQKAYNEENGIIPTTIVKEIRPPLSNSEDEAKKLINSDGKTSRKEMEARIKDIEKQMYAAAKVFDFERAAELRDILFEAKASLEK
ncbi:MAG: excinuclease ABC subunit UvrB [Firmicutes bacterium]|uniref:UvrABC system protein B n=1 Tax=Candidatus Alloenteromonas pullistercoris TaxID=2840785 RepID=A0A9D9GVS1_9FIRM|nr:excinuclease ABC subunit UvrB [Candidatus Enteromonas pullistercoris]